MHLTQHFTLAELTASDYAVRHGINNLPDDTRVVGNLHVLASGLERCRAVLGRPIFVTSGYRSPKVNAAVGGSAKSAHLRGLAADFRVVGMSPRDVCLVLQERQSDIGFDQLIYEGTWTHIAFPEDGCKPAGTVLTAVFKPGKPTTYTQGVT